MIPYFGGRLNFRVLDVSSQAPEVIMSHTAVFSIRTSLQIGLSPGEIDLLTHKLTLESQEYHPNENYVETKWLMELIGPVNSKGASLIRLQLKLPVNKETLEELGSNINSAAREGIAEIEKNLYGLLEVSPDTRLEINMNDVTIKVAMKVSTALQEKGLKTRLEI